MRYTSLIHNLTVLRPEEKIGKAHFEKYGKNLNHAQYFYLVTQPVTTDPLKAIYLPEALAYQASIAEQLHAKYSLSGLSEQDFMSHEKNMEVEQLLRFIDIPAHRHRFVECSYVVSGVCIHIIDGREYTQYPGSFVTLPSGVTHALFPTEDSVCLTIKIRSEVFRAIQLPEIMNFICPLAFSCRNDSFVQQMLLELYRQQQCGLPYCDRIMEKIFETVMVYIVQEYHDEMEFLVTTSPKDAQMMEIINYMFENYQTVTMRSLADHFHFNESYMSRMFSKELEQPFSHMLKEFKLRQAAALLLDTNLRLDDICDRIGYKDPSQFIRSFKQLYGVTPSKYRKQNR